MTQRITLTVNGQVQTHEVEPDTPLLYILRNDLGLKGAKFACGLEQCGACMVLIDGQARPSCRLPVGVAQGHEIITLEALGSPDRLQSLQQAFIEEQAAQCGFCTAGMIVATKALLDRNPNPTDDDIRQGLAANLCRCGVYDRILRAVKRAAGLINNDQLEVRNEPSGMTDEDAATPATGLPHSLQNNPELDDWLRINADGSVTLLTGKVEIGQGLKTALAQIGAEELEVALARVQVQMADTGQSPNEGHTSGSNSIQESGSAMRLAAAEARHILLGLAAEHLEAPLERLEVDDGTIADPASGRQVTYWKLFGGRKFGTRVSGVVKPKRPEQYRLVGQAAARLDLPAKVTGGSVFVHDMALPGMVHGRVVRPPVYGARLIDVAGAAVADLPGVLKIVRDGSFLGVIAEREEQAVKAMAALQNGASWQRPAPLPPLAELHQRLLNGPDQPLLVVDGAPTNEPIPPVDPPVEAVQTLQASYYRPYHMHAALGPSAALAQMEGGRLTVWTHSQGVYPLRAALALVLKLDEAAIRVIHVEGPGCYGHNGADDAALDAALLARALPGRPVMLKWMRADEHGWEPYGSAMAVQSQASLNAAGQIVDWNHDVWSYTHSGRPRKMDNVSNLLAAWYLAEPVPPPQARPGGGYHGGIHRNADPLYAFPRRRIVKHFVPGSPLRVSSMRGLGAYANVFAIESFMDELALAAGSDPVAFRLRHLADERARAVIEAAVEKAGWQPGPWPNGSGRGRGLAFAQYKNQKCYAAVVVELKVDQTTGQIQLDRAIIAADAGLVINPAGLANQLEGGLVQAASWTLKEVVGFDQNGITSLDWRSYPILTLPEAPRIETVLLNRPGRPALGSGEATQGPTAAAIANAVFDAVGVRLRHIPFTPEQVRAALADKNIN